jgi:hypothetical protein
VLAYCSSPQDAPGEELVEFYFSGLDKVVSWRIACLAIISDLVTEEGLDSAD